MRGLWPLFVLLIGCGPTLETIVIFHTSDVHGGIRARPARALHADPQRKVGGYAALANAVRAETQPWALLDSGDIFQGTPEGNLTKGKVVVAAMNALGYRAMVIGNHEYDFGEEALLELVKQARFEVLAANIVRREDGRPVAYSKPTATIEIGGVTVGIVGLATTHTPTSTLPANVAHLKFTDEVAAARRHATRLRAEGADVVVALTHCGLLPSRARERVAAKDVTLTPRDLRYRGDLTIARGAPVDVVMGGHTHTGLDGAWRDPESGVYVIQSYENLVAVNRVELVVDTDAGKLVQATASLRYLWIDELGEDPTVASVIDAHTEAVEGRLEEVVGHLAEDMVRAGTLDHALGRWMADVFREASAADIGVQNTFGIRDDLYAGPVTMRDLYRVMPFDNTLVVVTLDGAAVRRLVADNLMGDKSKIQVSGMTARFRRTDRGAEDPEIRVGDEPLNDAKTYRLATNNYLAFGGSGGAALADAEREDTARPLRALLVAALKKQAELVPTKTPRLELKP